MRSASDLWMVLVGAALLLAGCGNLPGKPLPGAIPVDPGELTDFRVLFRANCSGCHGSEGTGGAALPIADPVYLAIADDALLHHVISDGIAGTSMPAFARSAGGMLTDQQVDILARGLRERYGKPDALAGAEAPFYMSMEEGDAKRGAGVYAAFCSSCHGPYGKGGEKARSIVDGSFLALVTDQELRTMVIIGRPDLGAPDWRNDVPGKPMTSQEISDVVAWLSAQRPHFSGSPYPQGTSAGDAP